MTTQRSVDDSELEQMYADARRFPLLTADEEQEIDGRKWGAVEALHALFAGDPELAKYLHTLLAQCSHNPPNIKWFTQREQHFVLRRELAPYFADGKEAQRTQDTLAILLDGNTPSDARHQQVADLALPASLSVGIAVAMLRRAGGNFPDSVADAIGIWERHWTTPISALPLEPATIKALRQCLNEYTRARDAMVMHNLRLVHSIAGKYRERGVGYVDLVQEGTLGLIRAAEKYEFKKGFRFSTYCFNWITQSIRRYIGDVGSMVRFPTHVQEQINRIYRERTQGRAENGEELCDASLSERLGLDLDKTQQLLQLRNLEVSLDTPQFDDDDTTLADTMESELYNDATETAERDSLQRFLLEQLDALEPAEREVILRRWGVQDEVVLSRAEIADKLGVSREWVRQLERSALRKLKDKVQVQEVYDSYREATS
jgi:RNA polymerase sigma factor (sigma-70 family)